MSFISKTINRITKFFSGQDVSLSTRFLGGGDGFMSYDIFTDELLKALDDCRKLLTEENPRLFVNYSKLIYGLSPLYQKAINLRKMFLGTVAIKETGKPDAATQRTIKFIMEELPIYHDNLIIPKKRGIDSLLNIISEDCDLYGMAYWQLLTDAKKNKVIGVQVFKPTHFFFDYDRNGIKRLYYLNTDTPVNPSEIYCLSYQTIRGYDWGLPLIYGNKFMGDNIVKLINAEISGHLRNMNPYNTTIINTDLTQLQELPEDKQDEIFDAVANFGNSLKVAGKKALKGESVHLFANIPTLASVTHSQASANISIIDPKSLSILLEIYCAALGVPYQLLMDTTGSMSTDKYKSALLMMEGWASDDARPQVRPEIKRLVVDIFFAFGMPITDEIEVQLARKPIVTEMLAAFSTSTTTSTPNDIPPQNQ